MEKGALPEWYKAYEFVPTHYRAPSTVVQAARSLFQWHNETLNIYTHLVPGLYYLWLYMVDFSYVDAPWELRLFHTVSSLGPVAMGLGSAFAHTFYIVDRRWNTFVWQVDFAGIVCVNLSHQLLDTILLHKMYPWDGLGIILLAEVAFALRCIGEIFSGVGNHWGIQYPLLSGIPLTGLNMLLSMNREWVVREACLYSFLCTVFIFVAGIFFLGKIPERFCPGRFYYLHSHTLHHIFIICSIMAGRSANIIP